MPKILPTNLGRWALAMACLCPTALLANPVLSVQSATVQIGAQFDIAVSVSGVDAAAGLTAWQFDLAYDPAVVRIEGVSEGNFMAAFGATLFGPGVVDNANGLLSLVTDDYVDLLPAPSGAGVLAVLTFTALKAGQSALTLGSVFLNFSDVVQAPVDGIVHVGALTVPEPGTTGLAVLAALIASCAAPRQRRASLSCHPFHNPKELA